MGCSQSNEVTKPTASRINKRRIMFTLTIKPRQGKPFKVQAHKDNLIRDVKKMINDPEGSAFNERRLLYNGIQLDDATTLEQNNITFDATLQLVIKLAGNSSENLRESVKYAPRLSKLVDDSDPAQYKPNLVGNRVDNLTDEQMAAIRA
jgi:hypothetical protein